MKRLFMGQLHHRSAQVRHALSTDHTVLPATRAFIHEWNEHCLLATVISAAWNRTRKM